MKVSPLLSLIPILAPLSQAAVISSGHVDVIGIGYVDEGSGFELEPHSHAEAGAIVDGVPLGADTEYEPGELTILVPTTTQSTRAGGSQWDAMGISAGSPYWFLPQSGLTADALGAPFAGIGTEELTLADWPSDIFFNLIAMSGPAGGHFSMAVVTLGNPLFVMSTANGIDFTDTWNQPAGDHRHVSWFFTQPGDYDLTFLIYGEHITDGLKTATATYSFTVVPEPSTALLAGLGALALFRRRR
ncbi:MAG: choice-of-anchor M domain-containing protein [Akkermansiaceae bacterium]|jgi:surface-anchored protein|nr:choice-of-anchor M domain-containing protein [Akkermansiaceae bacterium]